MFHRHFSPNFKSFSPPKICKTKKKNSPRGSSGMATLTHENVGSRGKKGQKDHLNFAANIAMEFHCHTFCAFENRSEIPPVLLGIPWPALRGPLRNRIWKKRRPQPYWGGENSGNALEASNASNYRVWGIPAVSRGKFQETLWERFRGSFRNSSGISSGKSQPCWGHGPIERERERVY